MTLLIVVLIGVILALAAASTALRSVGRLWLRQWAADRLRGAAEGDLYLDRPQRYLTSATIASAMAASLIGALLGVIFVDASMVLPAGVVAAAAVIAILQTAARAAARRWAADVLGPGLVVLRGAELLTAPIRATSPLIERGMERSSGAITEISDFAEIDEMLRDAEAEGIVEARERAIISGVAEFGAAELSSLMTPRDRIVALPERTPPRELARRVAESGFNRVPLYRRSLDDVVGVVHVFDILKSGMSQLPAARPIPEATVSMRCSELLFRMLRRSEHVAIVRDASGRTVGLVTLHDLLQKLVGDIRDQQGEPTAPRAA